MSERSPGTAISASKINDCTEAGPRRKGHAAAPPCQESIISEREPGGLPTGTGLSQGPRASGCAEKKGVSGGRPLRPPSGAGLLLVGAYLECALGLDAGREVSVFEDGMAVVVKRGNSAGSLCGGAPTQGGRTVQRRQSAEGGSGRMPGWTYLVPPNAPEARPQEEEGRVSGGGEEGAEEGKDT